jgi:hypothetical protein
MLELVRADIHRAAYDTGVAVQVFAPSTGEKRKSFKNPERIARGDR